MDIRKEIESLALWYIPAFIIMFIASTIYSGLLKQYIEMGEVTLGTYISFAMLIPSIINNIDNLVLGIWLYQQSKKEVGRAYLWLFFGLVAHFFAAIIYIGLKIIENQKTYNKAIKKDV